MKQIYVDLPLNTYKDYYSKQAGGAVLPYFSGGRQRGAGLGNFLGKLMRGVVMPAAGSFARSIKPRATKHLLNLGKGVLTDALAGQNIGQSLKKRGLAEVRSLASGVLSGNVKKTTRRPRKRRRRAQRDIFS